MPGGAITPSGGARGGLGELLAGLKDPGTGGEQTVGVEAGFRRPQRFPLNPEVLPPVVTCQGDRPDRVDRAAQPAGVLKEEPVRGGHRRGGRPVRSGGQDVDEKSLVSGGQAQERTVAALRAQGVQENTQRIEPAGAR